jgi:uncharacterized lipoprotein NlpE involved in copper resistance
LHCKFTKQKKMKKILTLIAALFLVIGANAQSKLIKITSFDTGDSLVISEARIFKGTALTNSTCLVEYLGFGAEKKSVVANVSLAIQLKTAATAKQLVIYNGSANFINRSFISNAKNTSATTSTMIYSFDGNPIRVINLDYSIDSLSTLVNP